MTAPAPTRTPAPMPAPTPTPRRSLTEGSRVTDSPILPISLLAVGGYLLWFGVHYWRSDVKWPTDPIKALLTGKPIPDNKSNTMSVDDIAAALMPITPQAENIGKAAERVTISTAALKYQGQGYQFGGRADRPGNWDCSSYVFYVLAHDMGLSVLGGTYGSPGYPPHAHGPVAQAYKLYGTGVDSPLPGDLVVWNTHIGIAINPTQIVSARTQSEGTGVSSIAGTSQSIGETPVFRRVPLDPATPPPPAPKGKKPV